ncbi:uncharacterized protein LOC128548013 isoform X3 [Mercenaria mercenaria]|uniref:uncharacterized protein LOC128548013 isoform X3 n=1 Tax=Mercenaria mercenaria TaxID=6596 RepID=UPI00234F608F|nr:uncharacterized protein LOC128548013 isoform X3 [Mercenaria mercenaria]
MHDSYNNIEVKEMPVPGEIVDFDTEISKLEREISELERAVEEQEKQSNLLKAWQHYQNQLNVEEEGEDILRARVQGLKHQIDTLKELKGVAITGVTTEIIGQDKLFLKKKKQLNGVCGHVEFQLKMHIDESMDMNTTVSSKITHLSISASECVYRDLKDTVEHSFEIVWSFRVTDTYSVLPDIQLFVHVPKKVRDPNREILESASDKFQLMLKELGIEKTLNALVALLEK